MASRGADDRLLGLTDLHDEDSETLVYRSRGSAVSATIVGVVRRGGDASKNRKEQIDFTTRDQTVVEILRSAVSAVPQVGESFTDEDSKVMRISVVTTTDNTYVCEIQRVGA